MTELKDIDLETLATILRKLDLAKDPSLNKVTIFNEQEVTSLHRWIDFSDDDVAMLASMIEFFISWRSFGKMALWLQRVVIYLGWLIAVMIAIKGQLPDFLKGLLK